MARNCELREKQGERRLGLHRKTSESSEDSELREFTCHCQARIICHTRGSYARLNEFLEGVNKVCMSVHHNLIKDVRAP